MQLNKADVQHLCALNHEGKVIIVATVGKGATAKLYYTVKQDGFEDSALANPSGTGWESFQEVPFPKEASDASVVEREQQDFKLKNGQMLLKSIYESAMLTAPAPVQLVSHNGHVFIFRSSITGTLLADRFVLDGMANELTRKLEVRFKRSGQRHKPCEAMRITSGGRMASADSLDFRDIENHPFYEPTTEILPTLLTGLQKGWFSVVVVPTNEQDNDRWHFFATSPDSKKVILVSVRAGNEQPFDVRDGWFRTIDPNTEEERYAPVPGVILRELTLQTKANAPLDVSQGLAAVQFDVQREQQLAGGKPQLIRDSSRILLAVPTPQGIAALSFAIASDGTLAQIGANVEAIDLHSRRQEVLLPLNTLDGIRALGNSKPAPSGTIIGMRLADTDGTGDSNTCVQVAPTDLTALQKLSRDDVVRISGTSNYDGLYTVQRVQGGAFTIQAAFQEGEIGQWEKVEEKDCGLVFDGMLTGYTRNADGTLSVSAVNHGLQPGDKVQLVGSPDQDGEYPVIATSEQSFTMKRTWNRGEARNVRLESRRRRGLAFDGVDDWIEVPFNKPVRLSKEFTLETWAKLGSTSNSERALLSLASKEGWRAALQFTDRMPVFCMKNGNTSQMVRSGSNIQPSEWVHMAATYDGGASAMVFDGLNSVELPAMTMDFSHGFTFEAWIWLDRLDESERIFDFGNGNDPYNLFLTTYYDGQESMVRLIFCTYPLSGGRSQLNSFPGRVTKQRWMHVAATISADRVAVLYVDGVEIGRIAGMLLPPTTLRAKNYLGRWGEQDLYHLRGRLRDVRLWTVARTAEEVNADMGNTVNGDEEGLAGAWMLDTVTGGTALDATRRYSGRVTGSRQSAPTGVMRLLVNGQLAAAACVSEPPQLTATTMTMAARARTVSSEGRVQEGECFFNGQLSEARLWSCARPLREIENSMHLELTGREIDLYGCWRLGGLTVENDGSHVFDFSVEAQHGWVKGEPCAGSMALSRKLTDGTTRAVLYSNDELFAVREGAIYEERFEYRASPASQEAKFAPSIWGRASRSAEARIQVSPTSTDFPPAPTGEPWRVASWRFHIPSGMALLRCFEITDIQGDWETLEIRRHTVTLLSDTITQSVAREAAPLEALSLAPADAVSTRDKLHILEQQEASLYYHHQWLLKQLADLNNPQLDQLSTSQEKKTQNLKKIWDEKAAQLLNAQENPPTSDIKAESQWDKSLLMSVDKQTHLHMEYFDMGIVTCPEDKVVRGIAFYAKGNRLALTLKCTLPDGSKEEWVKNSTWNETKNEGYGAFGGDRMEVEQSVVACPPTETLRSVQLYWDGPRMAIKIWSKAGEYKPTSTNASRRPDYVDNEAIVCDTAHVAIGFGLRWKGNRLSIQVRCYDRTQILVCQTDHDDASRAYKVAIAEQDRLKNLIQSRDALTREYDQSRLELTGKLSTVRTEISQLRTKYVNAAADSQNATLSMKRLLAQTDPSGLTVEGALLVPTQVATRLHALESCAGRVTLSYLDSQSRLGQIHYDTTYGQDGRGEQWLPSPFQIALNRQGTSINVPAAVLSSCDQQITIEFWARCEPNPSQDNTFLRATGPANSTVLQIQLPAAGGDVTWTCGSEDTPDCIRKPGGAHAGRERWTHWAFVKDVSKGEMRILVNGRLWHKNLIDSKDAKSRLSQNLGPVKSVTLDASWRGAVSDLHIWNVALGDSEVEANRQISLTGNEPGLVACYPFNEAKGSEARDQTGQGRNLSSVGGEWIPRAAIPAEACAMRFDGVTGYVSLPSFKADLSTGFTLEAWVRYRSFNTWSRIIDWGVGAGQDNIILCNPEGRSTLRLGVRRGNIEQALEAPEALVLDEWMHVAATVDKNGNACLYKNGVRLMSGTVAIPDTIERTTNYLGKSNWTNDGYFNGDMRDVRLWDRARTADELRSTMHTLPGGDEAGLLACWPLEAVYSDAAKALRTRDLVKIAQGKAKLDVPEVKGSIGFVPLSTGVVCAEFSRVRVGANRQKTAMMQRCLALPTWEGVKLLDEQRIEELELRWVGNTQIKPTLLGYIEGPPPVPSENLTEEEDYNGATSVELSQSSDAEYSWTREQDVSTGVDLSLFVGVDKQVSIGAGIGVQTVSKELGVRAGMDAETNFAYHWQNASSVSAGHSLMSTDRLELRGSQEKNARFPQLGKRFIPKNVGYALVTSGMADIYVSRLRRSGSMVGYQVLPVEGVPLDVNTITFLINPAYTMAGSLDGMTGSNATSDRFFRHVPQMRSQYGSLFPASYFRLKEAYALKAQIDKQDMDHQAYFNQFNAGTVDETSLNRQIDDSSRDGDAPGPVGDTYESGDDAETADLNKRIDALNQEIKGLESKGNPTAGEQSTLEQKRKEVQDLEARKKARQKQLQDRRTSEGSKRQAQIAECHTDLSKRAHASDSFAGWQRKMESLQIRAGKRNIVNTYVWDGDGGLHAEEQQFASTVEHSIGGSFEFGSGLGGEGGFTAFGYCTEVKAMARVNLTQTMSKTERGSKTMELHVDLSEVESRGITDHNDYPCIPGEKVDRYRFMTFYLERDVSHWHDFFDYVVDPEWLASNDEEARALRETQKASPNAAWRVLHRVTYVERPTLMGFGRAPVVRSESAKIQTVGDDVRQLKSDVAALQRTLNAVLDKVSK